MKKRLTFLLLAFVAMVSYAAQPGKNVVVNQEKSYTVTFKESGTATDSGNSVTGIDNIINEGAEYVSQVTAVKVFNARTGRGVKLGSGSANGELTLTLAEPVKPTKIVVRARFYNDSEKTIIINDNTFALSNGDGEDCVVEYDGETEVTEIAIKTPEKRAYAISLKVYYNEASEEENPVAINSMSLVGTFPGMSWEPAEGIAMIQDDENPAIWSKTLEGVAIEATTYYYKATANGTWGDYELPADGNNDWVFGTDMYPAGTYNLTFTADTENHTLVLVPDRQAEVQQFEILTLQGNADYTAGKALLIEATEEISAQIWLTSVDNPTANAPRRIAKAPANAETMEEGIAIIEFENDQFMTGAFAICADKQFTVKSVTLLPNKDASESQGTQVYPEPEPEAVYTVVGGLNTEADGLADALFGTSWDPTLTANDMVKGEDGVYTKTFENVELQWGDRIYYKVAKNHAWNESWGFGSQNADYNVDEDGTYNVTFRFNPDDLLENYWNVDCTLEKTGEDTPVLTKYEVYLNNVPTGFGTPKAYVWSGEGENVQVFSAAWPGDRMQTSRDEDTYEIIGYSWQVYALEAPQFIIFTNSDGSVQTADLEFVDKQTYDLTALLSAEPEPFDYEKVAIDPRDHSTVESLQSFTLTFGGQVVTVNEDVFPTLADQEGGIALNADGSVAIDFEEAVTAPGNYTLTVPSGAILYGGEALTELTFTYTIAGGPDFSIDPAEGEVESLSTFTITFNNYYVDVDEDNAIAFLYNEESEDEVGASIMSITGQKVYVILEREVTEPGNWQLNIVEGITKTLDGSAVPEMAFNYTILGQPEVNYFLVGNMTDWAVSADYQLTKNEAADGEEYMITVDLADDAQFKVVKVEGENQTWYPEGMGNNFGENGELNAGGNYTVYFRPNADGGDDWFYNVIYVAANVEPADPWENVAITPANLAKVESLQSFTLDFSAYQNVQGFYGEGIENPYLMKGEEKVAEGTLDDRFDGTIEINFPEEITEPGAYTLIIPAMTIQVGEESNPELSFKYTIVGGEAWTIDPEGVVQESLGTFTVTFNGFMVDVVDDAQATLKNTTTGTEKTADIYAINGNKSLYMSFEETTEAGEYTLTIPANTVKKTIDDSFLDEMTFNYRIEGATTEGFTIVPAEGEVASLKEFTVTFDYYIDAPNVTAYLVNLANEDKIDAPVVDSDKSLYIQLPDEITAPGSYQLNVEGVSKTNDGTPVELIFNYTITGQTEANYYLVGNMTQWGPEEAYKLTKNTEAETEEYMITVDLSANDEFKVAMSADGAIINDEDWYPTGMGNNYVVSENGNYTIYFRPNGDGGDDWHYGFIFATKNVEPADLFANATIYPAEGEVASLKEFTLTFPDAENVQVVFGDEQIDKPFLVNTGNPDQIVWGNIDLGFIEEGATGSNQVVITLDEEVAISGNYNLIIPAGIIMIGDATNEEMGYLYTVKAPEKYEIYVNNVPTGFGTPKAYVWSGEGENVQVFSAAWPGDRMQSMRDEDTYEIIGYLWQVYALEAPQFIIFTNNDGTVQTADLEFVDKQTYDLASLLPAAPEPFDYEKIAIDPVDHSTVESLQRFTLTFGGQVVTVNEDVFPTLADQEGGIALNADGSVAIDFEEAVTAPGNYTLTVPSGAILYGGEAIDELTFTYTIAGGVDFTVDPEEGEVVSLGTITLTFNEFIEVSDGWKATLKNTTTGTEQTAYVLESGDGHKAIMMFEETTEAGDYTLTIPVGAIYKTADFKFVFSEDLVLHYTITGEAVANYYLVGNMTDWAVSEDYLLTKNENADTEEYMIDVNLEADAQFKVVKVFGESQTWYPDGLGNAYGENGELAGSGNYTVYFRPNGDGGSDWFYGVIYVKNNTPSEISNVNAEDEDGAVYYDALGRRTNSLAKGLLIKQVRTADGVKTVKVARK